MSGLEIRRVEPDDIESLYALLGFVAYYPIFSTFAGHPGLWMEDLFVLAGHRSRGIGRALLRALAKEALRRGCCKLEWSLQTRNVRGIAFYEREGALVREENRFAKLDPAAMARLVAASDATEAGEKE